MKPRLGFAFVSSWFLCVKMVGTLGGLEDVYMEQPFSRSHIDFKAVPKVCELDCSARGGDRGDLRSRGPAD